jgi:hypothetical protein
MSWQSTSPVTGFLPLNSEGVRMGSHPSGVLNGAMASTNTIYTQIVDISRGDNVGVEINYSGTATGTIQVMCSNSGANFYALTFSPVLTQPAGASGGYLINLQQLPFKYFFLQYTNASGSGTLTAYTQIKDLN